MKTVGVKVNTIKIRVERFSTCPAYSSICLCQSTRDAIECRLGNKKPLDFDEYKIKPIGFCPVIQSLN